MNTHIAFKAGAPYLPDKPKNPYWDDGEAKSVNREARRILTAKHRARRAANLALGCALFHAITGSPPIIARVKAAPRIAPPTLQIDTSSLL